MIHPGVRRRPLLLLPLPPSASADIAFDRKRAEINLLERGGGVRACVVRLCKLTERGLNTKVAREEERGGGWLSAHSVDGRFTQCAYWQCATGRRVHGLAACLHGPWYAVWKCVNTEYVCQYTEETSENSFQCLIQRCTRFCFPLADPSAARGGGDIYKQRISWHRLLDLLSEENFCCGRVSWKEGIWFFTFFPSYFIRIVREKKKGEKENRSKSDKIPSSMYFLRLLGDLGDFSLTRRNKGRKEKMMVDEDISAWRGEESREKNIISRVSKGWSRRETEISLNIA